MCRRGAEELGGVAFEEQPSLVEPDGIGVVELSGRSGQSGQRGDHGVDRGEDVGLRATQRREPQR
jgi:hypothetical protein